AFYVFFFFQEEDGIRDDLVTGVQTCALPIYRRRTALNRILPFKDCFRNGRIRLSAVRRLWLCVGNYLGAWRFAVLAEFDYRLPQIGRASCRVRGLCSGVVGGR